MPEPFEKFSQVDEHSAEYARTVMQNTIDHFSVLGEEKDGKPNFEAELEIMRTPEVKRFIEFFEETVKPRFARAVEEMDLKSIVETEPFSRDNPMQAALSHLSAAGSLAKEDLRREGTRESFLVGSSVIPFPVRTLQDAVTDSFFKWYNKLPK